MRRDKGRTLEVKRREGTKRGKRNQRNMQVSWLPHCTLFSALSLLSGLQCSQCCNAGQRLMDHDDEPRRLSQAERGNGPSTFRAGLRRNTCILGRDWSCFLGAPRWRASVLVRQVRATLPRTQLRTRPPANHVAVTGPRAVSGQSALVINSVYARDASLQRPEADDWTEERPGKRNDEPLL